MKCIEGHDSLLVSADGTTLQASKTLKILSYNVWFREDLEMHKRMKALGDLIQMHSPDLICFQVLYFPFSIPFNMIINVFMSFHGSYGHVALQEVTPNIYNIFQQSSWWKAYRCSVANEMAFTRSYFCMQVRYV